jgi:hypothetical protein
VPEPDLQFSGLLREHAVPGAVLGHWRDGEIDIVAAGVTDTSQARTRAGVGTSSSPACARRFGST